MADGQPTWGFLPGPGLIGVVTWEGVVLPALLFLAAFLALCWWRPLAVVRLLLRLLTHTVYHVTVLGRDNVPDRGGALLVCNHINFTDWLLLLAVEPRFVRYVLWTGWTKKLWPRRLLRWAGAITLDTQEGPRGVVRSLRAARAALARGELVCIFGEGRFTHEHAVLPFHRGLRHIARRSEVPIIPVRLDRGWGNTSALHGGSLLGSWPQEAPCPLLVAFGAPLPPQTRAAEVRLAVQELSADCAHARAAQRRPVHRQFVRTAARRPWRSCFLDSSLPGQELTYGRALAGAMCLARVLRPLLGETPMVGVWMPSSMAGALANIALPLLGKTSVNLNYTSSIDAVQSALRQCKCRHVLTARRFTARVPLDPGPGVELVYLEDLRAAITTRQRLAAILAVWVLPAPVLEYWALGLGRHHVDDLATVIFSSGSTGEPKGVMLTHGNVAANAESIIQAARVTRHDRVLGVLPFFHSFGYTVTLWAPLQVGASTVYHADPRQAREIGELCRTHRCTVYLSTATFLRFCLKKCEPDDFKSVRLLVCGAEKLPQSLAEDFSRKFGVLPLEGYGCTELSPAVAINTPDQRENGYVHVGNKPGTIGQALPGVASRIVDPETLAPLPVGAEGLLVVSGPNVMKGYLSQPELTRQVVRDGWYTTGDMGRIDEEGFITLTGRLSRFAKIGGEMVPLERVQEELHDLLGTSDRVCGVTCVPDETRGERLVVLYLGAALEQAGLDPASWSRRLHGRGLPNLWVPSPRDFYPVHELPVLGSGKLDLKRLKDLAVERAQR